MNNNNDDDDHSILRKDINTMLDDIIPSFTNFQKESQDILNDLIFTTQSGSGSTKKSQSKKSRTRKSKSVKKSKSKKSRTRKSKSSSRLSNDTFIIRYKHMI